MTGGDGVDGGVVTTANPLPVQDVAGQVDDAGFTPAASNVLVIAGEADDTAPDPVDEGDAGALRMSLRRELYVQLRDAAGNERGLNVDASGNLSVGAILAALPAGTANIGDVDLASPIPAGTNNIGDVDVITLPSIPAGGNKIGAVDLDSGATIAAAVPAIGQFIAGTDGTNARGVKTDAAGELQIDVLTVPPLVAGTANIGDVDVLTLPTLPAGDNNIGNVDVVTLPGIAGDTAHDSADSGNPVKIGFKAANALPTAVANNDRANAISDLWGRQLVSHIDPAMQGWKQVEYTSVQTGTAIWTPGAGKKIAITNLQITTGGTTAGVVTLWFGASADTTFTQGTDQVVFRGEFAPSATIRPGALLPITYPLFAVTADHILRITTSAAVTIYITVYGYEF